ncbi:MAG: beta-galactosidase, partial [Actinomycetota bacterium]|nr:beta-galactosidase [Actinomycetota bacterium]
MEFMTGFESTYIPQHDVDVATLTGHDERYAGDLRLVKDAGVRGLRYPVLWHQVEREPGRFDWTWTDATMAELHDLGLDPIVDLVHHTSFPRWIKGGMANPDFPRLHARWA